MSTTCQSLTVWTFLLEQENKGLNNQEKGFKVPEYNLKLSEVQNWSSKWKIKGKMWNKKTTERVKVPVC